MLIVSIKIIYFITLLSLFTYFFGLQSFYMYSEHRVMFTDEMVDFSKEKPPAILVAHAPASKPKNIDIIIECLKEYKHQEEKEYAKAVKCIDKNLKNETDIFEEVDNATKEYLEDATLLEFGRNDECRQAQAQVSCPTKHPSPLKKKERTHFEVFLFIYKLVFE